MENNWNKNFTSGPWKVIFGEYEIKSGNELIPNVQLSVATVWEHPQLEREAQIISQAIYCNKEGQRDAALYIRPEDAILISCSPEMFDLLDLLLNVPAIYGDSILKGRIETLLIKATTIPEPPKSI